MIGGKSYKSDKANIPKNVDAAPASADTSGTDAEPTCPTEKSETVCAFFARGYCKYKDDCPDRHDPVDGEAAAPDHKKRPTKKRKRRTCSLIKKR